MTIVVWDGESLAADRRVCFGSLTSTITKIFEVRNHLVGYSGEASFGEEIREWFRKGAKPNTFPPIQRDKDDWTSFIAISPDKRILKYERSPYPLPIQDPYFAIGSGRELAIAAMYCGKTAKEAVEVACALDASCGNGIDVLTFKTKRKR